MALTPSTSTSSSYDNKLAIALVVLILATCVEAMPSVTLRSPSLLRSLIGAEGIVFAKDTPEFALVLDLFCLVLGVFNPTKTIMMMWRDGGCACSKKKTYDDDMKANEWSEDKPPSDFVEYKQFLALFNRAHSHAAAISNIMRTSPRCFTLEVKDDLHTYTVELGNNMPGRINTNITELGSQSRCFCGFFENPAPNVCAGPAIWQPTDNDLMITEEDLQEMIGEVLSQHFDFKDTTEDGFDWLTKTIDMLVSKAIAAACGFTCPTYDLTSTVADAYITIPAPVGSGHKKVKPAQIRVNPENHMMLAPPKGPGVKIAPPWKVTFIEEEQTSWRSMNRKIDQVNRLNAIAEEKAEFEPDMGTIISQQHALLQADKIVLWSPVDGTTKDMRDFLNMTETLPLYMTEGQGRLMMKYYKTDDEDAVVVDNQIVKFPAAKKQKSEHIRFDGAPGPSAVGMENVAIGTPP